MVKKLRKLGTHWHDANVSKEYAVNLWNPLEFDGELLTTTEM